MFVRFKMTSWEQRSLSCDCIAICCCSKCILCVRASTATTHLALRSINLSLNRQRIDCELCFCVFRIWTKRRRSCLQLATLLFRRWMTACNWAACSHPHQVPSPTLTTPSLPHDAQARFATNTSCCSSRQHSVFQLTRFSLQSHSPKPSSSLRQKSESVQDVRSVALPHYLISHYMTVHNPMIRWWSCLLLFLCVFVFAHLY